MASASVVNARNTADRSRRPPAASPQRHRNDAELKGDRRLSCPIGMRKLAAFRRCRRALAGLALAALGAAAGSPACTLLLDTDANPNTCKVDADCARFPNAACDNARRVCVPR